MDRPATSLGRVPHRSRLTPSHTGIRVAHRRIFDAGGWVSWNGVLVISSRPYAVRVFRKVSRATHRRGVVARHDRPTLRCGSGSAREMLRSRAATGSGPLQTAEEAGTMLPSWVVSRVSGADAGAKRKRSPCRQVGWEARHSQPTTLSRRSAHVVRGNILANAESAPRRGRGAENACLEPAQLTS